MNASPSSTQERPVEALIERLNLSKGSIRLMTERAGSCSGKANMARDRELLDWVSQQEESVLMVRTYLWREYTLSLGKNQPEKDIQTLLEHYSGLQADKVPTSTVYRPTGGRAILHGDDISFAFITNAPVFLKLPLKDSYCVFTHWLKQTFHQLGYPTAEECPAGTRDYLRSPLCFETKTPSDILSPEGKKLAGCAQARKANGILQHGSAVLNNAPHALEEAFTEHLFQIVAQSINTQPAPHQSNFDV